MARTSGITGKIGLVFSLFFTFGWFPSLADDTEYLDLEVPCILIPGILQISKVYAGFCPFGNEELISEAEALFSSVKFHKEVWRAEKGLGPQKKSKLLKTPVPIEELEPGECFQDGNRWVCNLGSPEQSTFSFRMYLIGEVPGEFGVRARVYLKSRGRDSAVVSPIVTGRVLDVKKRLMFPWVSHNAGQFESTLIVNNFGTTQADLVLTGHRRNGEPEIVTRTIAPGQALRERASSLFPDLGSGAGYSVVVESSAVKISGHWVTNNLITGSGLSPAQGVAVDITDQGSPMSRRRGNQVMYGYLPITNGLTSAPVVINLGQTPTDVTLRFYDASGALVLEDTNTLRGLEPMRPFATVINDLVPQGMEDLHMVASATNQLTGVAFVFNQLGEPAIGNIEALRKGFR